MHLEQFERLLDQVTKVVRFPLAIINFISQVVVSSLEQVHNWQNLSVVWDEGLTDGV